MDGGERPIREAVPNSDRTVLCRICSAVFRTPLVTGHKVKITTFQVRPQVTAQPHRMWGWGEHPSPRPTSVRLIRPTVRPRTPQLRLSKRLSRRHGSSAHRRRGHLCVRMGRPTATDADAPGAQRLGQRRDTVSCVFPTIPKVPGPPVKSPPGGIGTLITPAPPSGWGS